MQAELLVQLVGEQPLPNLIPARYINPKRVLLVHTERTKDVSQRLSQLLTSCTTLECEAYNLEETTSKLAEAIREEPSSGVLFNLTGGTKLMSLAAYRVAQDCKAPFAYFISEGGRSALQIYKWRKDSHYLEREAEIGGEVSISLEDFLDAHFGKRKWRAEGPSKSEGGKFEAAVAQAIQACPNLEMLQGVRALEATPNRPQVDIDILVKYRNLFVMLECKTGEKVRTLDAQKQLCLVRPLLSPYTKRLVVLSGAPNPDHEEVYKATGTQYVVLDSYSNSSKSLSEEDKQKLIVAIMGKTCQ